MSRRPMKPVAGLTFEWVPRQHTYPGGRTVTITDQFRVYRNGRWIGDAGATIGGDYYGSVDVMGGGGRRTRQKLQSLDSAKRFIVREWRRSLERYDLWPITRRPGSTFVGMQVEFQSMSITPNSELVRTMGDDERIPDLMQKREPSFKHTGTIITDAISEENLTAFFTGQDAPAPKDMPVLRESEEHAELHDRQEGCTGKVIAAGMSGVKCDTCTGWFCY